MIYQFATKLFCFSRFNYYEISTKYKKERRPTKQRDRDRERNIKYAITI